MSRLQDKQCSLLKKKCLVEGCAQYDERLDACIWNFLPYNMYKVANVTPESMPQNQPVQGSYSTPRYQPG